MAELLTTMTLTEVVLIFFAILGGGKEAISLIEFFYKKIRGIFDKEYTQKQSQSEVLDRITKIEENIKHKTEEHEIFIQQIKDIRTDIINKFAEEQKTLQMLIDSDKDDIKSWIVQQYHLFMKQGWIDDFSLDALHKRYEHYRQEGGNSYIEDLMEKIEKLPNEPPRH